MSNKKTIQRVLQQKDVRQGKNKCFYNDYINMKNDFYGGNLSVLNKIDRMTSMLQPITQKQFFFMI